MIPNPPTHYRLVHNVDGPERTEVVEAGTPRFSDLRNAVQESGDPDLFIRWDACDENGEVLVP